MASSSAHWAHFLLTPTNGMKLSSFNDSPVATLAHKNHEQKRLTVSPSIIFQERWLMKTPYLIVAVFATLRVFSVRAG